MPGVGVALPAREGELGQRSQSASLRHGARLAEEQPALAADDERRTFPRFQGEQLEKYAAAADKLAALAREKDATLVQLAIAWTLIQPGVTACIVGAKSPKQVEEQVGGVELRQRLDAGDLRRIGEIAREAAP